MAEIDPKILYMIGDLKPLPATLPDPELRLIKKLRTSRTPIGAMFRGFAFEVGDQQALEVVAAFYEHVNG